MRTDRDFRFERHYELWKERNKRVARWTFGTVVFAAIVLFKVLVPYIDFSGQIAARRAELAQVQADLQTIEAEREALATVGERLKAVRATIERQPWMAEKDRLITILRELGRAYGTLTSASPLQVVEALREPIRQAQRPMVQQLQPPPLHPLADAAGVLDLGTEQLSALESSAAFRRLLDAHVQRRVQEEADAKVRRIVQRVHTDVIQSLERLLREDPEVGRTLGPMKAMLAEMRDEMEQWAQAHIGNPTWYETIQAKDRELRELTASLRQRQEAFIDLVRNQQQRQETEKQGLAQRAQQAQAQVTQIEQEQSTLNAKMQQVLPDWLRGLVSPTEMLQLYPVVLLGLVGIVGVNVGLVRHHFLVVREGLLSQGLSLRDAAVPSVWTLVYHGAWGTAVTAAVYLSGVVLLWGFFERGSALTMAWLSGQPHAAWAMATDWLPALRWLGRLLFTAAVAGVAATLLKDCATVSRHTSAAATSPPDAG